MEIRKFIATTLCEYLNEHSSELVKLGIQNDTTIFGDKIEGGLLNKKEILDLEKEIKSHYNDSGIIKFGQFNNDIRQNLFNYDNPLAQKDINGVNLRIVGGLIESEPFSGKRRKTYLLYADGKIIGKFYSVNDIKKIVKYIEDNLIKTIPSNKKELGG